MTRDKRYVIIKSFFQTFANLADQILTRSKAESIHSFRVNYKKFRAFLRLASYHMPPAKLIDIPPPIMQAYRTAGKMRDLHLYAQQLKKDGLIGKQLLEYRSGIAKKKRRLSKKLARQLRKIDFLALEKTLSLKNGQTLTPDLVREFLQDRYQKTSTLFGKKKPSDKDLHKARKYLKDIQYISGTCTEYGVFPNAGWLPAGVDVLQVEALTHQLGLLNDITNSLALIRDRQRESLRKKEGRHIRQIISRLLRERRKTRHVIHQMLPVCGLA